MDDVQEIQGEYIECLRKAARELSSVSGDDVTGGAISRLGQIIVLVSKRKIIPEELERLALGEVPFYVHKTRGWLGFSHFPPFVGCWPFNACEFYIDERRGYRTKPTFFRKPREPLQI